MKANEAKSIQITFTLNKMTRPPVKLNNEHLPQADEVKYLGMHLDRRLTWRKHITTKRKQLDLKLQNIYWIITRKQTPSLQSNSKASMDLWNPTVGNRIDLKYRDSRAIPVKIATHNNRCSMVYTKYDTQT
jgi:hypothetical protein